ncbi:uncharacterized protein LOC121100287 [Ursus maritimus]|uniref:Uncharacterized protein LOC121100287 n=1 Tax=Ursus maritimus TaxID=29073 RepID=A0A8M1F3V7_URSMA|nr:uncharacterized protein LOC121100287 [Ursus maritimus]
MGHPPPCSCFPGQPLQLAMARVLALAPVLANVHTRLSRLLGVPEVSSVGEGLGVQHPWRTGPWHHQHRHSTIPEQHCLVLHATHPATPKQEEGPPHPVPPRSMGACRRTLPTPRGERASPKPHLPDNSPIHCPHSSYSQADPEEDKQEKNQDALGKLDPDSGKTEPQEQDPESIKLDDPPGKEARAFDLHSREACQARPVGPQAGRGHMVPGPSWQGHAVGWTTQEPLGQALCS